MDKSHNLFQVYLRLRPAQAGTSTADRFIAVEPPATDAPSPVPTHIQLNPPNDRRRAVEKFAFTQVFEEDASQLDVFRCTNVAPLVEGVLAPHGGDGTDALVATLGVTGTGKSHTILGSRTQRGLTQMALDVVFRAIGDKMADCTTSPAIEASIRASDASEAVIMTAPTFLETVYSDFGGGPSRHSSRAPTPMLGELRSSTAGGPTSTPRRALLTRPAAFPQKPDMSHVEVESDANAEYVVLFSMYEVYNDRIFDLLAPPVRSAATKEFRRRPLLFKSTEMAPDRKVVAGLRKVVCTTLSQALLVLEAGLHERRVAGTGSNSASSRSHGFVCVEVKRRHASSRNQKWGGNTLTVVDLAGSERAREAKTAGATLAEAGKINESLMYLGQCLQMQSDMGSGSGSGSGNGSGNSNNSGNGLASTRAVPYRQCKLTELLFSNSFPSSTSHRRNPQKGVMIVTADAHGDFNATSQILRYSALAREITVPRIPSITQTILAAGGGNSNSDAMAPPSSTHALTTAAAAANGNTAVRHHRPFFPPGSNGSATAQRTFSPYSTASAVSDDRITMEIAALEIARMAEEMDDLRAALEEEMTRRMQAEAHAVAVADRLADRMVEMEQEIREECASAFDARLATEMARWKASLEVEKERGEEHWDRKVAVLERLNDNGVGSENANMPQDEEDKENVLQENLVEENDRLRHELAVLKRELATRSPTKRKPLREREVRDVSSSTTIDVTKLSEGESLRRKLERLDLDSPRASLSATSSASRSASRHMQPSMGSPKKMRKLSPRKWDMALDEDDLF